MLREAVQNGPDEREFLRRAADLYAQIGRASESSVLLVRATKAPRISSAPETMPPSTPIRSTSNGGTGWSDRAM